MNPEQYQDLLRNITDTGHDLYFLISNAMETIKQSETGMDDRWADLYAMARLVSVSVDLARTAQNRK